MTPEKEKELKLNAIQIRKGILKSTHAGHSGHPGGSLSSADLLAYLYTDQLRVDPNDPHNPHRDRFVLSKGHCSPGLYAALALKKFIPETDLETFRHFDSYLQGHPNMRLIPGVDMSTGSLGQGLSIGCGMALGAKMKDDDFDVYVLLGDGEIEEGQNWEAAMFAHQYHLDNLCAFVDCNGLQIDGKTSEVMDSRPLDEKFASFGANVMVIDGHDFKELEKAFDFFKENKGSGKATFIIMNTTKGKGISFMENQPSWHGKAPDDAQFAAGMAELTAAQLLIEGEQYV